MRRRCHRKPCRIDGPNRREAGLHGRSGDAIGFGARGAPSGPCFGSPADNDGRPRLQFGHSLPARLHHAVGVALRSQGAARDPRPDERDDARLQAQVPLGAVSRPLRCADRRPRPRPAARMDRGVADRRHADPRGGRFRRPGAMAPLDDRLLDGAGVRRCDAGCGDRRLAHHGGAHRASGADGLLGRGRVAHRQSRRGRRGALSCRRVRLAGRLSLHGGIHGAGARRRAPRPGARLGHECATAAADHRRGRRRADQGVVHPPRSSRFADAAAGRRLSDAGLHLQRHGGAAVQKPALFQLGHRHGHEAVRFSGCPLRHVPRQFRGAARGPDADPPGGNRFSRPRPTSASPSSRRTAITAATNSGSSRRPSAPTILPTPSQRSC